METIRNYLETMFASLPNTETVQRAKSELLQMMEDKYTELINEGRTETEAVGTVISEFGNPDELADDLGIKDIAAQEAPADNAREISMNEAKAFISDRMRYGLMIAIGVYLCITSVCGFLFCEAFHIGPDGLIGLFYMLLSIAAAVGLFIFAGTSLGKWEFLKEESCRIDDDTADYISNLQNSFRPQRALLITIGVILCIMSFTPMMIIEELFHSDSELGAVLMFIIVGIGVMLFITSAYKNGSYEILLHLNKYRAMGENLVHSRRKQQYSSDTVASIMDCYWPTVTCMYLIWSFLGFSWWISWIIWPIAGIISAVINKIWRA